jgi:hypothetical protein
MARKIMKYGALALGIVVAGVAIFQVIWKQSGSNQWELESQRDGITIYSMKSPGYAVKKFKTVFRIKGDLPAVVKMMEDPEVCDDIGCRDSKIVERVSPQVAYHSFVMDFPFPFQSREIVTKVSFSPVPQSKGLFIAFDAAPDKVPPSECCYRVKHMKNSWQFTPVDNGQLEVEYILDMDEGVPSVLLNTMRPTFLRDVLVKFEGIINRPKYQNASYDFLKT